MRAFDVEAKRKVAEIQAHYEHRIAQGRKSRTQQDIDFEIDRMFG